MAHLSAPKTHFQRWTPHLDQLCKANATEFQTWMFGGSLAQTIKQGKGNTNVMRLMQASKDCCNNFDWSWCLLLLQHKCGSWPLSCCAPCFFCQISTQCHVPRANAAWWFNPGKKLCHHELCHQGLFFFWTFYDLFWSMVCPLTRCPFSSSQLQLRFCPGFCPGATEIQSPQQE